MEYKRISVTAEQAKLIARHIKNKPGSKGIMDQLADILKAAAEEPKAKEQEDNGQTAEEPKAKEQEDNGQTAEEPKAKEQEDNEKAAE